MKPYRSPYDADPLPATRHAFTARLRRGTDDCAFYSDGMPDNEERECFYCGKSFAPDMGRDIGLPGAPASVLGYQRRGFCSIRCTIWRPSNLPPITNHVSDKVRLALLERDNWHCYLCGVATPLRPWGGVRTEDWPTIDHVIPLKRNGTRDMDNLRCACMRCNRLKCTMDPWTVIAMRLAPGVLPATTLRRLRRIPDLAEIGSLWRLHVCRDGVLQDG